MNKENTMVKKTNISGSENGLKMGNQAEIIDCLSASSFFNMNKMFFFPNPHHCVCVTVKCFRCPSDKELQTWTVPLVVLSAAAPSLMLLCRRTLLKLKIPTGLLVRRRVFGVLRERVKVAVVQRSVHLIEKHGVSDKKLSSLCFCAAQRHWRSPTVGVKGGSKVPCRRPSQLKPSNHLKNKDVLPWLQCYLPQKAL